MWLRGDGDEVSPLAGGTESQASVVITMARSFYSHIKEAWRSPGDGKLAELQWQRKQEWRRQGAIVRVDRPTRLDKARELGYKAKQGVVVARVSVRKGTARKQRHKAGRRSKRQGVKRISRRKSIQRMGEERVSRKYPNLRALNSYWVGEDGSQKWFEVILVDPEHPAIENDDDLNWICSDKHKGRAFRGLTNAGKDNRGLDNRGKGSEHVRPSVSSGQGRGK
jgi:large subunit ribosomal protein L15e